MKLSERISEIDWIDNVFYVCCDLDDGLTSYLVDIDNLLVSLDFDCDIVEEESNLLWISADDCRRLRQLRAAAFENVNTF